VLVKVKAASINPGEAKIREGVFHKVWPARFPSGEGSDLAGIVTQVGIGVLSPVSQEGHCYFRAWVTSRKKGRNSAP
jgi:NADPH:quinone reductase-like Zn-dependent oxidoreductase